MPYATPDDVRGVLAPDPTLPNGTPGELSDATLDERIAAASAQVDSALTARYTVPFLDPAPRLVKDITVAIAAWLAALTYRRSVDITATDPLTLRYQWALGLLGALAKGDADLPPSGNDPGDSPPPANRSGVAINPYPYELFPLSQFGLTARPSGRVRTRTDPSPFWEET